MTRVAAIDCGTNSLRLLVAELDGDGTFTDLAREMRVVRLGQDVDRTGRLAPEAIARTTAALADYVQIIERLGATRVRMVATSATRDAANREEFATAVADILGAAPDVISGDEEAALSFRGATVGLGAAGSPYCVVDIGGGSTELVLGADAPLAARSVDVGCVRLTERYLTDDPPTAEQVAAARTEVRARLDAVAEVVPVTRAGTVIGVAGSVTTVAGVALGLTTYDPALIHHARLSRDSVRRVTAELLSASREQRARIPVMHPGRVDVIGGGALVLDEVMERFELAEVMVSERDILDGIALSVLDGVGAAR